MDERPCTGPVGDEDLVAYCLNEVDVRCKIRISSHLESCAACRSRYERTKAVVGVLERGSITVNRFGGMWWYAVTAVAAMLLAVVGVWWAWRIGEHGGPPPATLWEYATDVFQQGDVSFRPVAGENRVFVVRRFGYARRVVAVDPESGKELWIARPAVRGYLAFGGGKVFVLSLHPHRQLGVTALSAADGSVLWSRKLGTPGYRVEWPVVCPSGNVAVSLDGRVWVFDGRDGTELWNSDSLGLPSSRSSLACAGGRLFYVGEDGGLLCVSIRKGRTYWRSRMVEERGIVDAGVGVAGGYVVAMASFRKGEGTACRVVAFDVGGGGRIWNADVPPSLYLLTDGERVYLKGEVLTALSVKDGRLLWKKYTGFCSPVALAGGRLFTITREGRMTMLVSFDDESGRILSREKIAGCCAGLAVAGGKGYVSGGDGKLRAVVVPPSG